MIINRLNSDLKECGIELSDQTLSKTEIYLDHLLKWRQKINLTSVASRDELARFHILEAFWAAKMYRSELNQFVDIGSGAGFPGMAIKIFLPNTRVTLIEPNFKRAQFLKTVAVDLKLDLEVFHGKAESFPDWEKFKTATIRALKPSPDLLNQLKILKIKLLVFRGNSNPIEDSEWIVREELKFPLSRNRFACLFESRSSRV